jgi:hypothetical protein
VAVDGAVPVSKWVWAACSPAVWVGEPRRCATFRGIAQISPMVTIVVYVMYSARIICAARSPMITHGAMVLPVVMRGMIEPSAIRRRSTP